MALAQGAGAAPARAAEAQPPDTAVVEIEGLRVSAATRLQGDGPARALTVLDRATLEALPVQTVAQALEWAVGVDLQPRSGAQADVAIRGGTGEQVLVLVDGVPVNDAQTGHFHLDLALPLAAVERIEVVRGAGSAVHGAGALGGVIHIVTRPEARGTAGTLEVEAGSFGRRAASGQLAGRAGGWSWVGSAQLDRSDGHRDGTDHDMALAHLSVSGRAGGGVAALRLGWARRDFGADGFYAPYPSYEQTRTRTAAARWTRPLGPRTLEVAAHLRAHDDDFTLQRADPAFYRNLHSTVQGGVDLTLRSAPARWVWAAGAGGGRDALASATLGDRRADRGALFGEIGWNGPRTRVHTGLRLDAVDGFAPSWSPTLSAEWSASPAVALRAALARSFRTPTWTDRFYEDPANRGDPDLAVEHAWSGEVGVDWTSPRAARLRATAFVRRARDLIDYARPLAAEADDDAVWQTRNVASATFRGVEVEVDGIHVGPAALDGALELLRVDARTPPGMESKYALRPLARRAQGGLRLPVADHATLGLRLTHRRRVGEPAHTTADLHFDVRIGNARLRLAGVNLADTRWRDVSGMPAEGRSVQMGAFVRFGA